MTASNLMLATELHGPSRAGAWYTRPGHQKKPLSLTSRIAQQQKGNVMSTMIEVKIINPILANVPEYQTVGSAALDLHSCEPDQIVLRPGETAKIGSGIALNMMPYSHSFTHESIAAMILPRSGKATKEGLVLANLVGLIDQDFHGEIIMACWNRGAEIVTISPLERIAQLVFVPVIKPPMKLVEEFSCKTERGAGGFGSTGAA